MSARDIMNYDVAIVGAGPAGLACALRLRQLDPQRSVCVIEKAASLGAHSLSGAVLDPVALDALLPGWRTAPPPTCIPAFTRDNICLMAGRFRGLFSKAPSRSTTWINSAPSFSHLFAMAAGSSEKTVSRSFSPCRSRTHFPFFISTAGITIIL